MCIISLNITFVNLTRKHSGRKTKKCNSIFFRHNTICDFVFTTGQYLQRDLGGQVFPEMPKTTCKNVLVIK
jgi:hypothetical protein